MINREVFRRLQKLKANFDRARLLPSDAEVLAHWARYLCVLTAGLVEKSVIELLSDYITNGSSPAVATYAINRLEQLQNPKTSKIAEILGLFRADWRTSFDTFAAGNGRKDAIDSVMANRHSIAHGEDSGITLSRAREYFDKCEEVLEYIETLCTT